jgi:hypothetical protein
MDDDIGTTFQGALLRKTLSLINMLEAAKNYFTWKSGDATVLSTMTIVFWFLRRTISTTPLISTSFNEGFVGVSIQTI